jgi:hypothetical protein
VSKTKPTPTEAELLERYKAACDLKQVVNRVLIEKKLTEWLAGISEHKLTVRFIDSAAEMEAVGKDAWDARAARDAWDAWAARDARAARDAWDAWAARAARDAWDAWAARAARDAWDAWVYSWEVSWVSITAVGALSRADSRTFEKWYPFFEAFESGCYAVWLTKTEMVVAERPIAPALDNRRRLHSDTGPAFDWLKDIRDYYWHGVFVPEYVIMKPELITAELIEKEKNAEVRRVMIERFPGGVAAYLQAAGSKEIHRDETGILYRKDLPEDEPILMVKVRNSTAEPDGTFKDYFLRVPPATTTAKEGVAWTFEKNATAYAPLIET